MKDLRKRIEEQVKKLSREELERKYVELLFNSVKDKKNARLIGTLGSMISSQKKKKQKESAKEQYYQDLEHPKWHTKRMVIINRDKQCAICGSHLNLQVHHTKYIKGKRAWEYPNSTLVTLCRDCHQKVHQYPSHPLYPKFIKKVENIF